jgi:hypothetical protein
MTIWILVFATVVNCEKLKWISAACVQNVNVIKSQVYILKG